MTYNTCLVCGANSGRAGLLIASPDKNWPAACMNCHDTRKTGQITIYSNLRRTDEEIAKTIALITPATKKQNTEA